MKQFILWYFTEKDCKALQKALNGKTFYNFQITYSKETVNCALIVSSDYNADVEEIKRAFINYALNELASLLRKNNNNWTRE